VVGFQGGGPSQCSRKFGLVGCQISSRERARRGCVYTLLCAKTRIKSPLGSKAPRHASPHADVGDMVENEEGNVSSEPGTLGALLRVVSHLRPRAVRRAPANFRHGSGTSIGARPWRRPCSGAPSRQRNRPPTFSTSEPSTPSYLGASCTARFPQLVVRSMRTAMTGNSAMCMVSS
jgi:hypothetical protein